MTAVTLSTALNGRLSPRKRATRRVLPGFHLTLGYTLFYLSLIVLIPLSALLFKTFTLTWVEFWAAVASPRVLASYQLTFGASFLAALFNVFFGLLLAWVLVRYEFPGKKSLTHWWTCPLPCPRRWPVFRSPPCWRAMAGLVSTWSRTAFNSPSTATAS